MKSISKKAIWLQLKADLIGKDSYRGVTLTYSWLANQIGHFSLGFIPTLFVSVILEKYTAEKNIPIWSAVIISIAWLLFETYNFLGPLLLKKKSYSFSPPWANIAFDTFTDLCFFWLGAFSASLFLEVSSITLIIFVLILVILIYPACYWYLTKMYLQSAQYPFQCRLSQWEGKLSEHDKETVSEFIKNKETGCHLFVFGTKGCGKTSMAVGIASEKSIGHLPCFYSTGLKLFSMFFESDSTSTLKGTELWTWRKASLLVIDDINPGCPVKNDIVTSDNFLKILDTYSAYNKENRDTMKSKNVIWVLGDENLDAIKLERWKAMLMTIGVEQKNIKVVNLQ